MAMGALGASRSVYIHFIARGLDVVFPKNTAMENKIASRPAPVSASPQTARSNNDRVRRSPSKSCDFRTPSKVTNAP